MSRRRIALASALSLMMNVGVGQESVDSRPAASAEEHLSALLKALRSPETCLAASQELRASDRELVLEGLFATPLDFDESGPEVTRAFLYLLNHHGGAASENGRKILYRALRHREAKSHAIQAICEIPVQNCGEAIAELVSATEFSLETNKWNDDTSEGRRDRLSSDSADRAMLRAATCLASKIGDDFLSGVDQGLFSCVTRIEQDSRANYKVRAAAHALTWSLSKFDEARIQDCITRGYGLPIESRAKSLIELTEIQAQDSKLMSALSSDRVKEHFKEVCEEALGIVDDRLRLEIVIALTAIWPNSGSRQPGMRELDPRLVELLRAFARDRNAEIVAAAVGVLQRYEKRGG